MFNMVLGYNVYNRLVTRIPREQDWKSFSIEFSDALGLRGFLVAFWWLQLLLLRGRCFG